MSDQHFVDFACNILILRGHILQMAGVPCGNASICHCWTEQPMECHTFFFLLTPAVETHQEKVSKHRQSI